MCANRTTTTPKCNSTVERNFRDIVCPISIINRAIDFFESAKKLSTKLENRALNTFVKSRGCNRSPCIKTFRPNFFPRRWNEIFDHAPARLHLGSLIATSTCIIARSSMDLEYLARLGERERQTRRCVGKRRWARALLKRIIATGSWRCLPGRGGLSISYRRSSS